MSNNNNLLEMIEWCTLLSGYSKEYYEKMSISELTSEYEKLMNQTSDEIKSTRI